MTPGAVPRVVVDTSVIVGLVLRDEPWHLQSVGFLRDAARHGFTLAVAPTLRHELRHGLVRAARRGRIDWDEIPRALRAIDALDLATPEAPYPDGALLGLCRAHALGWGDAHVTHLAMVTSSVLVTADDRLIRSLHGVDVWVERIGDRSLD